MQAMELFPLLRLSGTPFEIGFKHGQHFKTRIDASLSLYRPRFNGNDEWVKEKASLVSDFMTAKTPRLLEEMKGIAAGSGNPLHHIVALNSRTEFLRPLVLAGDTPAPGGECTTVCFPKEGILGESWDWYKASQELAIVLHITEEDGHQLMTLTEPGVVGKIGLNNQGMGVTLNFLPCGQLDCKVPIHVFLRHALSSKSVAEFDEWSRSIGPVGTSGAVVLCSAHEPTIHYELKHENIYRLDSTDGGKKNIFFRTNHFLAPEMQPLKGRLRPNASSKSRYEAMKLTADFLEEPSSSSDLQPPQNPKYRKGRRRSSSLMRDMIQQPNVIKQWKAEEQHGGLVAGTVCVVVMDLKEKKMFLTEGEEALVSSFRTLELRS